MRVVARPLCGLAWVHGSLCYTTIVAQLHISFFPVPIITLQARENCSHLSLVLAALVRSSRHAFSLPPTIPNSLHLLHYHFIDMSLSSWLESAPVHGQARELSTTNTICTANPHFLRASNLSPVPSPTSLSPRTHLFVSALNEQYLTQIFNYVCSVPCGEE